MLLLLCVSTFASAQTDSTEKAEPVVKKTKVKTPSFTYFRIGIDITKIIASFSQSRYTVFEAQLDANYKSNLITSLEFGAGNSNIANDFLSYKSSNLFLRAGIDKTFFAKNFSSDMDNAFVGVRYGFAPIHRKDASYSISDPVWGNTQGTIQGSSFAAHWLELNGGFRLELIKYIFIGWNIRFKTMLNAKKFEELPPAYIAGYGRGDKNTAFGYNFYILYGIGRR